MKNCSFLMLVLPFIIITQASNVSLSPASQHENTKNAQPLQSFERNLSQMPTDVQYALQLPGLKYVGPVIYLLGFRIVGMQNLIIWQVLQLYQEAKSSDEEVYFQLGNSLHGYSNPSVFALQGFGYGFMFLKLNLMWEVCVILFIIAIVMKHIIAPCHKNKALKMKDEQSREVQIEVNPIIFEVQQTEDAYIYLMEPRPTTKNFNDSNLKFENNHNTESTIRKQKMTESYFSRKDTIKENSKNSIIKRMERNSLQTMNRQHMKQFKSKLKQTESIFLPEGSSGQMVEENKGKQSKNFHQPQNELSKSNQVKKPTNNQIRSEYTKYKKTLLISNVILNQVVFYILINSLTIIGYSSTKQTKESSDSDSSMKMSFSGYMIGISSLVMFMYTFKLISEKGKGSGETKSKFRKNSYANKIYWLMAISQRIVYSALIGSDWQYGIAGICGFKLIIMILAKFFNVWERSADYYRNLVTNFIHLLILIVLTLDQYYFAVNLKVNLSKSSVAFILLCLLAICFIINFVFFIKNLGIFTWIGSKCKVESNQVRNASITIDIPNQTVSNAEREHTKHVKFTESQPIQLLRQQQSGVKFGKTKKSTKNIQSSLKSLTTQKSIGTLYQSEIRPSIKSEIANSRKQISSRLMTVNSQSTLQKGSTMIHSENGGENFQNKKPTQKLQIRTHKQISRGIDDALRAQKTQQVIFEQTTQNDCESEDADVVSIQMEHKK